MSLYSNDSCTLSVVTSLINVQRLDRKKTLDILYEDRQYIYFNQTSFPHVFVKVSDNLYESRRRYVHWIASQLDDGSYLVRINTLRTDIEPKYIKKENVSEFIPYNNGLRIKCHWYCDPYNDSVSIVMSHTKNSMRSGVINSFGMINTYDNILVGPYYTIIYDFDPNKINVLEEPSNVFCNVPEIDLEYEIPWHRDELHIARRNYNFDRIKKLKELENVIDDWLEKMEIDNVLEIKSFYSSPPLKWDAEKTITRKKGSYQIDEIENIIEKIGGL